MLSIFLVLLVLVSLPFAFVEVIKAEQNGPSNEEITISEMRSSLSVRRYANISGAIKRGKDRGIAVEDLEQQKAQVRTHIINGEYAEANAVVALIDSDLLNRIKAKEEAERLAREEEERRREAAEEEARQRGTIRGHVAINSKAVVEGKIEIYNGDEKVADTNIDHEGNYSVNIKGGEYKAIIGSSSGSILFQRKVEISAGKEKVLDISYNVPTARPAQQRTQQREHSSYGSGTLRTSRGEFGVDMMTFDLASGSIRVITDTAENSECANNCSAKALSEFARENGAFAGLTGAYFCPPDYDSCQSSINYFFWKVYNSRLGKMINENNGLGENDHFLAFDSGGHPRYFTRWTDFKTSGFPIYAGINSKPALVENGQNILNVDALDEKQRNHKIKWGALGLRGETLYAVVGSDVTVVDMAAIMTSLGVDNAMALDGGGTTALIYDDEYKLGPGRNMPNAILFARR
ncbi:MAG: phosphodiester glycosidase family protein [Patescibacteria group bacterium]